VLISLAFVDHQKQDFVSLFSKVPPSGFNNNPHKSWNTRSDLKFLRPRGSIPTDPQKTFWGCCGSTVLTATGFWPSNHSVPAQMFVFVSVELNHNRSPWVLLWAVMHNKWRSSRTSVHGLTQQTLFCVGFTALWWQIASFHTPQSWNGPYADPHLCSWILGNELKRCCLPLRIQSCLAWRKNRIAATENSRLG